VVLVEMQELTSAGISPLPWRERADAEGGRVRGAVSQKFSMGGGASSVASFTYESQVATPQSRLSVSAVR
jgi:hypothetical protein